jgi:hypothetical protein
MFSSKRTRLLIVIAVVVGLAAVGLQLTRHMQAEAQAKASERAERNDEADGGVNKVDAAVFAYYQAHRHAWPLPEQVNQTGLSSYLPAGSSWPVNPFDGRTMHQGTGPGDYEYRALGKGAQGGVTSYSLIGFQANGKSFGYRFVGSPGPIRVHAEPGCVLAEGLTAGSSGIQADGEPMRLTAVAVDADWGGRPRLRDTALLVKDATRMFDGSGVLVPQDRLYSYSNTVCRWRALARREGSDWVAVELQALETFPDLLR